MQLSAPIGEAPVVRTVASPMPDLAGSGRVEQSSAPVTAGASIAARSITPTAANVQAIAGATQVGATGDVDPLAWIKGGVVYQIVPERFRNFDHRTDPAGTEPWGSTPTNTNFMGGDLPGITEKLDYIADLGATAIYTTPVGTSPSNHKYNVTDYDHVDPAFGGDDALHELVDTAKGKGIDLILDAVNNHTGDEHEWFQSVIENGEHSPHLDKYEVTNFPIVITKDSEGVPRSDDYVGWNGYATLPVLNKTNPDVRKYFIEGPESLAARYVTQFGARGIRADAADEPGFTPDYWSTARATIKAAKPDAYFLAENMHDATGMLQGDQFDGAMNYPYFLFPAVDFFAKKSNTPDEFLARLQNGYPAAAKPLMLNSLSTHDMPRFITQADGDWYRMRPATIFQMTYVGVPSVYYGDEVAMEGRADPANRGAFPWERVTPDQETGAALLAGSLHPDPQSSAPPHRQVADLTRAMIALRKAEPAFHSDGFTVLGTHNDDRTLSYRRMAPGVARDAVVAINNDTVAHDVVIPMASIAADGTCFTDGLSGRRHTVQDGQIVISGMDGNWGAVLLRNAR